MRTLWGSWEWCRGLSQFYMLSFFLLFILRGSASDAQIVCGRNWCAAYPLMECFQYVRLGNTRESSQWILVASYLSRWVFCSSFLIQPCWGKRVHCLFSRLLCCLSFIVRVEMLFCCLIWFISFWPNVKWLFQDLYLSSENEVIAWSMWS